MMLLRHVNHKHLFEQVIYEDVIRTNHLQAGASSSEPAHFMS